MRVSNPYAPIREAKSSNTQPNEPEKKQEKQKLKQTLSDEGITTKPRSITSPAKAIFNPPQLPARNLRLGSMPSNTTRPIINKPTTNTSEEVYESIKDENQTVSPTSNPCSDDNDENAYASVDHEKIKIVQNPPSLPAPRLPVQKDMLKAPAQDMKKSRKKNRNSLRDKAEHPDPVTPNEPIDENPQRKKTKSFAPFFQKERKKVASSDQPQPESPHKSFESSTEIAKHRGALPPVPKDLAASDSEEGYSCIEANASKKPLASRESRSSSSSAEGPYSELKFDPKKKRAEKKAPDLIIAVDYKQSEDGNTSPMEIDQAYSCIDDVKKQAKDKSPITPSDPLSDLELPTRALPQLPNDAKKAPHQYVDSEEIKRRKKEQRYKKEEERRLSGAIEALLPDPSFDTTTEKIEEEIVEKRKNEPESQQFMSLKSIFSDFHKDEDIVTQTLPHVLGLAPPEPPHDSDDETQSYASVAKVLEQKRAKKTPIAPEPPVKSDDILTTEQSRTLDKNALGISLDESIGDHTYSTLVECQPYEEPNVVLGSKEPPMYEDIRTEKITLKDTHSEAKMPMYESIGTEVKTPTYEVPVDLIDREVHDDGGDDDEPKSKIASSPKNEDEYATPRFENVEPEVDEKVSQNLSKLREQKGYVKVSHQKDNMPEYASIDDVKKASNKTHETKEDISQNAEVQNDVTQNDETQNDIIQNDEIHNDVTQNDDIHNDEIHNDVTQNDETQNDMIQNDEIHNDVTQHDETQNDMIQNDEIHNDVTQRDETQNDMIQNDEIHNDVTQHDEIHNDVTQNDETQNDMIQNDEIHNDVTGNDEMHDDVAVIPSEKLNDDAVNVDSNTDVIKNEATIREDSENSLQSPEIAQDSS